MKPKRHCRDPKCVAAPGELRHIWSYGDAGAVGLARGRGLQVSVQGDPAHVAHGLPPWDPAAPRHDSEGQPVFHTRREIREYEAKRPGMRFL